MDKKKSLLLLTAVAAGSTLYNLLKPIRSNVPVVQEFDLDRYLGDWYEIARMDFFWEKNLKNVSANYSLNEDGSVGVLNQGFDTVKQKNKRRQAKASFVRKKDEGALKVSFFGPFYFGYNVVKIDENYKYALVFGENLDYMWILSRVRSIPDSVKEIYLNYAEECGYNIENLVWTVHD